MKRFSNPVLGAAILFSLTISGQCLAADASGISMRPAAGELAAHTNGFSYHTSPGTTATGAVTVFNDSNHPTAVQLYSVDATSSRSGILALNNRNESRTDVGGWIQLTQTNLVLPAHGQSDVSFTITAPHNPTVGDHAGGIVAELAPSPTHQSSGLIVDVVKRFGVPLLVSIPGTRHVSLAVAASSVFAHRHAGVRATVVNHGNTLIHAHGSVTLRTWQGHVFETVSLTDAALLPSSTAVMHARGQRIQPLIDHQTAHLTIDYEDHHLTQDIRFWWVDWPGVIELIVVAFGISTAILLWRRKPRLSSFFHIGLR